MNDVLSSSVSNGQYINIISNTESWESVTFLNVKTNEEHIVKYGEQKDIGNGITVAYLTYGIYIYVPNGNWNSINDYSISFYPKVTNKGEIVVSR